ncbi:hypothetical protein K7432_012031 [Basidiobolus ranarum]|uniref:BHLH domain-containing protein n=1 Tax=Basidiobolus ranarum TaxID=34480 RepID=A0ABR2VSW6_9FUNG
MPPLNFYKDQVDYSSYFSYAGNNTSSRFASPFDEDNISGQASKKSSQIISDQPLFLNFTADLSPQNGAKKLKTKKKNSYKVNGVNILNRKSLDSSTALERLQKRRENHNSVERKRRDNINSTIMEISELLPGPVSTSSKPNKGNILKLASKYIKELKYELRSLKNEVRVLKGEEPLEEEVEETKDLRKRKNLEQESSDESEEDNENEEKEDQEDMDNDEDAYSSAEASRQVSPEPSPEDVVPEVSRKQSIDSEKSSPAVVEEVKQHSEPEESKPLESNDKPTNSGATTGPVQPSIQQQAVSSFNMVSSINHEMFPSPEATNFIDSVDKLPSYPILGGSKRQRADNFTLPGMGQFTPMTTTTLSHMHTFNAAPRHSVPASPFGFQLPGPSHSAPSTPSTNNQSHFVNHMASPHNYQPHPHARGPPHMMFREYNGNVNMY